MSTKRYSYGDSTDSPLTSNFLEFLGEALSFCAHVHGAEERLLADKAAFEKLKASAATTRDQLRALAASATTATTDFSANSSDARVKKCGSQIAKRIAEAVSEEVASLDASLEAERLRLEAAAAEERRAGRDALGKMLLGSEPPESKYELSFEMNDARAYVWSLQASMPWGFSWSGGGVEAPKEHPFAELARVERFVQQGIEVNVQVPISGWLKKEMKVKPNQIGKFFITAWRKVEGQTVLSLRDFGTGPEAKTTGYDFTWGQGGSISVSWIGELEAAVHELSDEDIEKMNGLRASIEAACSELLNAAKNATSVEFNGASFETVTDQMGAVTMLVAKMAPMVREISKHSLNANELVLRRLLGKDRREEIFVTKSSLIAKLLPLPSARRALFAPLELGDLQLEAGTSTSPAKSVPPPVPSKSVAPPAPAKSLAPAAAPTSDAPVSIESTPQASGEYVKARESIRPANPLARAVKQILALAKEGKADEAFLGYADFFKSEMFVTAKVEDQRQALRLMVHSKTKPVMSPAVRAAYGAATDALTDLVKQWNDASDLEMLGICQTVLELKDAASATFAAAVAIESERDPASPRLATLQQRAAGIN